MMNCWTVGLLDRWIVGPLERWRGTLALGLVLVVSAVSAQHQDITFVSDLGKDKMLANSTVEYQLTLRNAQGTDPVIPDFKDFIVLQGPNRRMGTSLVNGLSTSYMSFTWLLQPRRTGRLTVEPASIRAAGRTYRANSQTVEVLPVAAGSAGTAPDNFLRAEVSTSEAVVGQQIILNLNLYSTNRPLSRNVMAEPDFDGFYTQARRQFDGSPRPAIENGKEYEVRTLGSVALFPLKSGELTIAPYRIILGIIRFRDGGRFSRRSTEQISLSTDSLRIRVRELPQPRPDDFSGGVGTYRVEVSTNRNDMTTDDALTLRMTVTGQGDVERLTAPSPVDPTIWDVYDPVVLQEEWLDSPSGLFGRKIFEYKLVPKREGNFTIAPALTYFNTDSSAYLSDAPQDFTIRVAGGSGQPTYDTSAEAEELSERVLLPAGEVAAGRRYGSGLSGSPGYWGLFLLPLLLAGGLLSYRSYRSKQASRDPAEVARERAAKLASQRLSVARTHRDKVAARPFYDAVEDALLGYLRDRLEIPGAELGRKTIGPRLLSAGAGADITDRYDRLLQRCEMALYAGQDRADDLAETYEAAKQLILDTEKALR